MSRIVWLRADEDFDGPHDLLYEQQWNGEDDNTAEDHLGCVEFFASETGGEELRATVRDSVPDGFDLNAPLWWVVVVPSTCPRCGREVHPRGECDYCDEDRGAS